MFREIERRYAYGAKFTVDVCASQENAKCDVWIDEELDGLVTPWGEDGKGVCFCNPPWNDIDRWLKLAWSKVEECHVEQVVMLVPSRTATGWFQLSEQVGRLVFLRGRINYDPPPGVKASSAGEGSLLVLLERPIVPSKLSA